MRVVEELQEWPVVGEVPAVSEQALRRGAEDHFENRARALGRRLANDHEVSTIIDDERTPVISSRKKEIAIGATVALSALSVAGILAARHHLRIRHKK